MQRAEGGLFILVGVAAFLCAHPLARAAVAWSTKFTPARPDGWLQFYLWQNRIIGIAMAAFGLLLLTGVASLG